MPTDTGHLPERLEKSRLMDRYAAAINEFSRCAGILNTRMGTMYRGDYERLARVMDDARDTSEACHKARLAHIAEHGC